MNSFPSYNVWLGGLDLMLFVTICCTEKRTYIYSLSGLEVTCCNSKFLLLLNTLSCLQSELNLSLDNFILKKDYFFNQRGGGGHTLLWCLSVSLFTKVMMSSHLNLLRFPLLLKLLNKAARWRITLKYAGPWYVISVQYFIWHLCHLMVFKLCK